MAFSNDACPWWWAPVPERRLAAERARPQRHEQRGDGGAHGGQHGHRGGQPAQRGPRRPQRDHRQHEAHGPERGGGVAGRAPPWSSCRDPHEPRHGEQARHRPPGEHQHGRGGDEPPQPAEESAGAAASAHPNAMHSVIAAIDRTPNCLPLTNREGSPSACTSAMPARHAVATERSIASRRLSTVAVSMVVAPASIDD